MKKLFNEFKEFAMRGNVMDMAVGVVIGAAFGKITTSLVNDVFMPLIGLLIGGIDRGQLNIVLKPEVLDEAGEVVTAGTGHVPVHHPRLCSGGVRHLPGGQGHQQAPYPRQEGRGA